MHAVWIAVDAGLAQQVKVAAEAHKALQAQRLADPKWHTFGLCSADAARRRAAWRTEVQRQRRAGELLDTRDVLVEYGVGKELRSRGWDCVRGPGLVGPAPATAAVTATPSGSPPASMPISSPRSSPPADTPPPTDRTVTRVAATSTPASPRHRLDGDGRNRLGGPLAEYMQLTDQVTTTGTIGRACVTRGLVQVRVLLPSHQTSEQFVQA
ncbi:hypothetical protein [Streptomyces sp. PRh5]|uniref:hypothetical protein n=1 Tax=Streptomyces sp. PRh5 TaxID=1158056 RepID=UPI0004AD9D13|nr:hypothetical protein [Streptomyces sp. PRh5]